MGFRWQSNVRNNFFNSVENVRASFTESGIEEPDMGTVSVAARLFSHLQISNSSLIMTAQWVGYADVSYPVDGPRVVFPPDRMSLIREMSVDEALAAERKPMRMWHPELNWTIGNDIYGRSVFFSGSIEVTDKLLMDDRLEAFVVDSEDPVEPEDR